MPHDFNDFASVRDALYPLGFSLFNISESDCGFFNGAIVFGCVDSSVNILACWRSRISNPGRHSAQRSEIMWARREVDGAMLGVPVSTEFVNGAGSTVRFGDDFAFGRENGEAVILFRIGAVLFEFDGEHAFHEPDFADSGEGGVEDFAAFESIDAADGETAETGEAVKIVPGGVAQIDNTVLPCEREVGIALGRRGYGVMLFSRYPLTGTICSWFGREGFRFRLYLGRYPDYHPTSPVMFAPTVFSPMNFLLSFLQTPLLRTCNGPR